MRATDLGIPGYDGEFETPSEAYRAAYVAQLKDWQRQLGVIAAAFGSTTSLVDRDDAKLLAAQLDAELNSLLVYEFDRKDYGAAAIYVVEAIFTQFQYLPIAGQDGATLDDVHKAWSDITSRLAKAPAYIVAAQRLVTTPGHLYGVVRSKQLAGAAEFLNGALTEAAKSQLDPEAAAYAQFLKARDATLAAIAESKEYIDTHVASWPENYSIGREAYDRMLRDEKLLPFDATDMARMGQVVLAHGWAEEAWLTAVSTHTSTPFGAQSGGGMAPGGPALISYYRDRIAELRKFVIDNDLVTIPDRLGSMEVMETPSFLQPILPGAAMDPPRLFSASTTGYYYITPPKSLQDAAARLDMNVGFDRDRIFPSRHTR